MRILCFCVFESTCNGKLPTVSWINRIIIGNFLQIRMVCDRIGYRCLWKYWRSWNLEFMENVFLVMNRSVTWDFQVLMKSFIVELHDLHDWTKRRFMHYHFDLMDFHSSCNWKLCIFLYNWPPTASTTICLNSMPHRKCPCIAFYCIAPGPRIPMLTTQGVLSHFIWMKPKANCMGWTWVRMHFKEPHSR